MQAGMASLKNTYVKDFKAWNIKDANKVSALEVRLEDSVALGHQPLEESFVDSLGHGAHHLFTLLRVHIFLHDFLSNLNLGL